MRVYFKNEFNKTTNYIGCRRYKREKFYEDSVWYFIEIKILPQINKLNLSIDGLKVS
jgi:hypothetical protein